MTAGDGIRRDAAALFGAIFHSTREAVVVSGLADGRVYDANPAFCRLVGYQHADVVGRTTVELGVISRAERDRRLVPVLERTGSVGGMRLTLASRTLGPREADVSAQVIELGGERCVLAIVRDVTDQVRGEEERHYLEALLDSAPVGMAIMDTSLRYVRVNEALAAMNGRSVDDHVGRTVDEVLPDMTDTLAPLVRRVVESRLPVVGREISGVRPSTRGRVGHWIASYYPLLDASGGVLGVAAVVTDIGPRRRAEEALGAAETRKTAILEAALDCIVTMDAAGTVADWNPAAEHTFGYAHEQAVGRPLAELIVPPALRERHWAGLRRHLETGESRLLGRRIEITAMRADGSEFPVELAILRVDLAAGPLFTGYLRDISARRRAEDERRRLTAELSALVDTAPVAIIMLGVDGRVLRWNQAAEGMFGWSRDEADQGLAAIVPPDRAAEQAELARRSASGEPVTAVETVRRRRDGSLIDVSLSQSPLRDEDGAVTGTIVVLGDITARKRSERRLQLQYDVTRILAGAGTVEEVTERVLCVLGETLGWDWVGCWRFEPSVQALRLAACWRGGGAGGGRFDARSGAETFPPGVGLPGAVYASASPRWIADVTAPGSDYVRAAEAAADGIHAAVGVPIRAGVDTIGVLELAAGAARPPDPDQEALLAAVAAQLGQFAERAAAAEELRAAEVRRQALLAEILHAEQAERARIASELHDDTIQVMAASLVALDRFTAFVARGEDERARGAAARTRTILAEATERTRQLMFRIRPPVLEAGGLEPAVRDLTAEAARTAGFRIELRAAVGRYPWAIEELAYRALQEAVTNAAKHAGADVLTVAVEERDGALHGSVRDDGAGFDVTRGHDRRITRLHLGFDAIQERIRLAGGDLVVESSPGRGTTVEFRLPTSLAEAATETDSPAEAAGLRRQVEEWAAVLDTLLSAAPVGFAFWDRNLRYVRINEALADINGRPVAEHVGRTLADVLPELARTQEPIIRDVLEKGAPVLGQEVTGETPAAPGMVRHWLTSYYPVRHTSGDVIGVGAVVLETTALKRAERERERLLEQADTARREAEQANDRIAFLAEAGQLLASSLDYRTTLAHLADLAVPRIADWCSIDILAGDGSIQNVRVAHADPAKVALAAELQRRYPPRADQTRGVRAVIRTGRPELYPEIPREMLTATARDEEHLRLIESIGLRSAIVVPLVTGGRIIGALTLVDAESGRRYGEDDLAFAQQLARRAAVALDNARLYEERSRVALTLQESLLPAGLPAIEGLDLDVAYNAAGEHLDVGGDFYDVLPLPGGDHLVLLGDVSGRGVHAAAATGLARHTTRAIALSERSPARILRMLNTVLRSSSAGRGGDIPADERFLTAVAATLRAGEGRAELTVASGGHPPPFVLRASGTVEPVACRGTLLGVFDDVELEECDVELAAGDAVVFYTDGVIEAGRGHEVLGGGGLRKLLARAAGADAAGVVAEVVRGVRERTGGLAHDDVAVLVIRVEAPRRRTGRPARGAGGALATGVLALLPVGGAGG